MLYVLLFLEGVLTFISPCLLPMLPVYVSFFAAGSNDKEGGSRRVWANAAGFILGFTLVFVLLGAFAGTLGRFFIAHAVILNIVTGTVVIILGLNFLGVINIVFLNRLRTAGISAKGAAGELRFFSSVIFGVVFSAGWTPCVGAFLGAALMMASSQGSAATGVLMLLVYSLGLGIPFIASAILIDKFKGYFDFIKRHYKIVNTLSGIFLIFTGILMATGVMGRLLAVLAF